MTTENELERKVLDAAMALYFHVQLNRDEQIPDVLEESFCRDAFYLACKNLDAFRSNRNMLAWNEAIALAVCLLDNEAHLDPLATVTARNVLLRMKRERK